MMATLILFVFPKKSLQPFYNAVFGIYLDGLSLCISDGIGEKNSV